MPEIISAAIINGCVAYEVNGKCPGAFYHYGTWYIFEREYYKLKKRKGAGK